MKQTLLYSIKNSSDEKVAQWGKIYDLKTSNNLEYVAIVVKIDNGSVNNKFLWTNIPNCIQNDKLYKSISGITFSPDNNRLMYRIATGKKHYVICGSEKFGPYDEIYTMIFSPDSKSHAFIARIGTDYHVIYNGKISKPYAFINNNPTFSPDSKRFLYIAAYNRERAYSSTYSLEVLTLVDRASKTNKYINSLTIKSNVINFLISPDSSRIATITEAVKENGDRNQIYISDNINFEPVDETTNSSINVINNNIYSSVNNLIFSPDSKHCLYSAKNNDGRGFIICDNVTVKTYDHDPTIIFIGFIDGSGPKSKAIYVVEDMCHKFVTYDVDSKEFKEIDYDYIFSTAVAISPDNKKVVYLASFNYQHYVICGDILIKLPYSSADNIKFSPNSRYLTYSTKIKGSEYIFVYDLESKCYKRYGPLNCVYNLMIFDDGNISFITHGDNQYNCYIKYKDVINGPYLSIYSIGCNILKDDTLMYLINGPDLHHFCLMVGPDQIGPYHSLKTFTSSNLNKFIYLKNNRECWKCIV